MNQNERGAQMAASAMAKTSYHREVAAPTPSPPGALDHLNDMALSLASLESAIADLGARLTPVLASTGLAGDGSEAAWPSVGSELSDKIVCLDRRTQAVRDRVREILDAVRL